LWVTGIDSREANVSESFVEYRHISVSDPLRQGDVLESVDSDTSMWQRHLLVITADCDFVHSKHRGRVTCVPILTKDEYLLEMAIPHLRDKLVKKPLGEFQKILKRSGSLNVTDQRVRAWVCEQDDDTITASLGVDGEDRDAAVRAMCSIRLIDSSAATLEAATNALVEAQLRSTQPPKRSNAINNVLAPLRESFSHPPGDALFLSAVAPAHEMGYYVYLRHLEQIWEPQISTGPTHHEVKYRRISRLQDRFIHALVQRFAMVFMSIGLPREYEDTRDMHADMLEEFTK
jgi:hypothetical protein